MIDRDTAVAPRHHAADDRRHALRRLRPAAGLDHLHAAQPVSRGAGGRPAVPAAARTTLNDIYVTLANGTQVPLSAFTHVRTDQRAACRSTTRASSRSVTLSFNLAPGASLGDAVKAIQRRRAARSACPASIQASFQGTAAGVPDLARQRAAADPGRAGHRLHRARRAVRELHPPDHDSLDAAFGRRRRACWRC